MNIVYIHFHEEIGGGEKYFINIVNLLPKEYGVYLFTPNESTTIANLINRHIFKISQKFIVNIGPLPVFSYTLFYKMYVCIKENNIDIIHFSDHNMVPTMIALKCLFNIKIVFTSHGRWDVYFFINKLLLKLLNPTVIVSTDIHFFRVADYVDNIYLISMIVQEPNYTIEKNISSRKVKLGIVGRFSPVKNHRLALEIFTRLDSSCYELHIYGDQTLDIAEESDEYRKEIYGLIEEHDNVFHHGIVHNQDEIYNNTDILLQTSITEASSLVTVESQKYGLPLVCSFTEASSYAVINGYNGFVCHKVSEYVEAIEHITNNYVFFSSNSAKNAKNFSAEKYMNILIGIYEG